MTAPQEPLVMTLERALLHLKANAWWLEPNGGGWSVFAWSDRDDPDAIEEVSYGLTWFEAVSEAINRPVVARDDAAELRAALTDWARADRTASEAHNAWLSEAAKGGASYTGNKSISIGQRRWAESLPSFRAWVRASEDRYTAEQRLQELARAALAASEGQP